MNTVITPQIPGRSRATARRLAVASIAAVAFTAAASTAASAAAGPNDGGSNCHGVWMSYLSTSGMSPGQLQGEYGVSVRDVQATADIVCS